MFKEISRNIHSNNIIDFIGETDSEYLNDLDEIAEDRKGNTRLETEIIQNLCEVLILKNKGLKIVDVGCGEGCVLNSLDGYRVGVDSSELELTYLAEDIVRVRANVEDLPFEDEYFDVCICTDVFEHVENEKRLSSELYRILKVGGLLLFSCPWEQDLSVYDLLEYRKKYKLYKSRHRRSISDEIIKENFRNFRKISETLIVSIRKYMEFSPYSIKFIQFMKE